MLWVGMWDLRLLRKFPDLGLGEEASGEWSGCLHSFMEFNPVKHPGSALLAG